MTHIVTTICRLGKEIFKDHPGQSGDMGGDTSGKKRKGGGKTVSSFYKEQLANLMTTLHATEPHFIRYTVPQNQNYILILYYLNIYSSRFRTRIIITPYTLCLK